MWASLGLYLIYYFSLSVTAGGSCGMKSKQQASSGTDCCSALELIAFPKFSCLIPVAFCKTCFFSSIVSWLTVLCWIIEVRSLASQDTVLELWFLRIIWGSFILLQVWLGFFSDERFRKMNFICLFYYFYSERPFFYVIWGLSMLR